VQPLTVTLVLLTPLVKPFFVASAIAAATASDVVPCW